MPLKEGIAAIWPRHGFDPEGSVSATGSMSSCSATVSYDRAIEQRSSISPTPRTAAGRHQRGLLSRRVTITTRMTR
jgi:hypothetical protein